MTDKEHLEEWAIDIAKKAFELGYVFGLQSDDMSYDEFAIEMENVLGPIIEKIKGAAE